MAVLMGKKGSVKYGSNTIGTARSWTITTNVDAIDISTFGLEWRKFAPGMGSWSGSVESLFDPADAGLLDVKSDVYAAQVGDTVYLELICDTGVKYSGSAFVTSSTPTANLEEAQTFSFDFQGTGQLTATWS